MSWSYLTTQGAVRPLDLVRLNIGDTLRSEPQFQDEEILSFLAGRPNIYGACADACRALSTRYARSVNQKAAQSAISYSDLSKAYARSAAQFDQKASSSGSAMPYAGGISVIDKMTNDANTDRVKPQFALGLDDNNLLPTGPTTGETEEDASTGAGAE